MRALITGITGFAGGFLAQALLDQGHEVFGVSRWRRHGLAHLSQEIVPLTTDLRESDRCQRYYQRYSARNHLSSGRSGLCTDRLGRALGDNGKQPASAAQHFAGYGPATLPGAAAGCGLKSGLWQGS